MTPATRQSRLTRKGWIQLAFVASLLLGTAGPALGSERIALPEFLMRSWDSADGLPAARVQAVAQTDDGYLWVGTSRGLARFDGSRFVILTTNNTPALGDDRISALLVSRSGDLWVGTEDGTLSRRRGGVFEPVSAGERLRGTRINSLTEDHDVALWIGTQGAGMARWCQGVCDWFSLDQQTNFAANDVTQIVTDRQGRLWAVAGGQLAIFKNGAWQFVTDAAISELRQGIVALAPAQDGSLWLAACAPQNLQGRGTQLFKLNGAGWTNQLSPYPWRQDSVFTRTAHLMEDRAGRLWVATVGAGIFVWTDGMGWRPLSASEQSSIVECSSLAEGKEGVVWVGTTDFLLFQIRSRPVTTLHLPESARQNVVLAAYARRDGSVWVGTDGKGAYCYRQGRCDEGVFEPGPDNFQAHVGVFYEDRKTNFWAGTWAGLYHLEGGQFRRVTNFPALTNVVLALFEDRRSNLWAGTSVGVVRCGPDGTNLFARAAGIDHFYIRAIEEDRAGQIWVAITDRGLYRKTGERFEHYGAGQWAGEERIREIHADADDALWITTDSRGLARLKDGKFSEWTSNDGLPSDNLVAVTEDKAGNLWFSSANGIFGCPKSRLLAYQRGVSPPILFWQLSADEGLDTRRCSGAGQPVAAHSEDGRLWFPNWHALAVFDPVQLQRYMAIRPLAPLIEETLVDGVPQTQDADGVLRARSAARSFEFHYTSPTLQSPEQLQFRYRLKGLDPDWVDAGSRRAAYYTHLPVGRYEFQVRAGGPDGVWQDAWQGLPLEIVPRFWERRSVQILGATGLLAVAMVTVWSVSRARMRRRLAVLERQRALDGERSRIARDMHDEIGARLTQISLLSALADGSAGDEVEVRTQTKKISSAARSLTRSLDEIVWAVRPQNDNLESLVDYLGESLRDLCEDSPVRYWFSGPSSVPTVEVPANVRHNVLLACSEIVNNTLKHSGASEVRVNVRLPAQSLEIEIRDNGHGFDVAQGEAKRSGLIHIRQRLEEIGGSCVCRSVPGEGTHFAFSVPIGLETSALPAK
jgi:ligand-binding sensor domain-containing protein/signal transduction histidine kinase